MPINYSSLYSFENVNPIIKRKKLPGFRPKENSSGIYWGDPTRPDPSLTGIPPGKNAREVLTGKGGTPPYTGEDRNYLGIPQKNLKMAFGLAALSHAVNPSGAGKELMHYTGAMLSGNARIGERARELMREEQREIEARRQEIEDRELTYDRGLKKEERERFYKEIDTEDTREYERGKTEEKRRYNAPLRNAQIAKALRGPKPSEFDEFESYRKGKVNPKTNQPYTYEENLADYKSLGRASGTSASGEKWDEEKAFKNAQAEWGSLGVSSLDTTDRSINFPEEKEVEVATILKRHGISYYPEKTPSESGKKKYYLGGYKKGQVSQPSGTTFNLEDYLPK